jgi:small-conductance mechanosensitive channel
MRRLGSSLETQEFLRAVVGTVILAIAMEALLRAPQDNAPKIIQSANMRSLVLSVFLILLWLFRLAGFWFVFLLGLTLLAVPAVFSIIDRSIAHLLRPVAGEEQTARHAASIPIAQRALRAIVLIAGALYLHGVAGAQFPDKAASAIMLKIADTTLNAVVAFALFDFVWHITRGYIDKKIVDFRQEGVPASEQTIRRHRMGTVLPILRNFIFILIAAIVGLMYLSSIGIAITPLLAGASVFGIAIGFGAQTLVKDVLSGIFYLLDDAFRIGEYIQSGSYMGTVEGFTLRSIRLRHHRGPVFTVPFGSLGAIQNMSRDWALDKIVLGVTYDADIVKAKKLIKQVGQELLANPEFAPHIVETLKMQGVDELGDFAVKIKLKIMTRPGEQAPIRRWALARIKTLFDENGIAFAYPTVKVAEGRPNPAAAVLHALPKPKAS